MRGGNVPGSRRERADIPCLPRHEAPSLDALLGGGEWNGAEFKAARHALPKSVFETVSACE
jgi:hypothetical protein